MTRLLATTALASLVVLAGCGGSSSSTTKVTVARANSATSSATSTSSTGARAGTPNALAFAKCMRANGAANFPDPAPGGGFVFGASGINPAAPAVQTAQAKCHQFMPQPPNGPAADSSGKTEAQALAQLRSVARCMRQHGISDFPDPQTSAPSDPNLGEYSDITNYEGVFLLFPATIDMQSPAWEQAAAACGPLAESFNHPHH